MHATCGGGLVPFTVSGGGGALYARSAGRNATCGGDGGGHCEQQKDVERVDG